MPRPQSRKYDRIGHPREEKDPEDAPSSVPDPEDEPFLPVKKPGQSSSLKWAFPWVLSAIFATSSCLLLFLLQRTTTELNSQQLYQNDFINPKKIPLEQVKFTGSPQFDANGTMSHKPLDKSIPWPENVTYFGEPSPEIDENWRRLIEWRYFSISEDEAKRAWGASYHEYVDQLRGGYTAGLDVFHTLHCVNAIRKALRPDYYNHTSHNEIPHADHCLDAIRQYVQCAGITTLIPTQFHEGIKRNYIESDQLHTCRSFTFLREWVDSRKDGGPSYVERDQTVLDPKKHAMAEDRMAKMAAHLES